MGSLRLLGMGTVLALLSAPLILHGEGSLVLENENLQAVFSARTGALTQLVSLQTGWRIQKRAELGRSFRMLVPLPNKRFNPVFGKDQDPPKIVWDRARRRIEFLWPKLRTKFGGPVEIGFRGAVELTDEGLVFTAEVQNRSEFTVETVYWPYLGDLSVPPGADHLEQIGIEYGGAKRLELFPKFDNMPGYFGVDYPTQMLETPYTPFSLIDSGREGLYVGYHDTTAEHLVQFMARLLPGYVSYEYWDKGVNPTGEEISGQPVHLEFAIIHFPFVNPGEEAALHPVVLQPYRGDWHSGADVYKKWRRTHIRPPRKPKWLRQVHSWQQIHMNNPEDDIRYRYKDLVTIGRDCARHGVGAIQVTGWTIGGQDSHNPSHDIDPRLGTWQDLRDAIQAVQKLGVKIVLFAKFTWADRTLKWYHDELIKYATKDPYGAPHYYPGYAYQTATQLADINTHRFAPMCPLSADWRAIATKEFLKTVALGADGILYDENQHHGGVRYCYDPSHGHHVPAHVFAGDGPLAEGFHQAAAEKGRADYLFAGEGNYDLEFRQYHLSYFRVDLNHLPLHRYVAPEEEMMIAVGGYNDRNMINLALMYRYIISYEPRNFKGRLIEFPLTLQYGGKVDALRRRYSQYLWNAEFLHTVGAKVTASGQPYGTYSVFRNQQTGKRAVVVVNFDYQQHVSVAVELPRRHGPLLLVTPESPDPVPFTGYASIPPNSAIIVLEQ